MSSPTFRRRDVLCLFGGAISAAFLLPVFAACGGDDDESTATATSAGAVTEATPTEAANENETVQISLGEMYIKADPASVAAGIVEFVATNEGSLDHELVIILTDLAADALPVEGTEVNEDAAGDVIGEISEFPAGETQSGTFTLEAGHYALICNILGHYQAGMFLDFEVT